MNIPMNIPIFFGPIWFFKVATSEAVATCQGLRWVEQLRSVALDDYFDFNGIYPQKINFNKPTLWYLWCFHGINYICISIYIYVEGFMWLWVSNRERIDTWCLVDWFGGLYYPISCFFSNPWTGKSVLNQPVSLGTTFPLLNTAKSMPPVQCWGFNHWNWRNVDNINGL